MNRYSNGWYYKLYSMLFGYDERKFWERRQRLQNPQDKTPKLIKMMWLIYLKRAEARNASSMGTSLDGGAVFKSIPTLPHGITGIFVSDDAVIGENCTILQNVTIGRSKNKAPVIGNNCVIGACAVLIGGIHVGDNCCIGANCTVYKDVPDNTTVVCGENRYIEHTEKTVPKGF